MLPDLGRPTGQGLHTNLLAPVQLLHGSHHSIHSIEQQGRRELWGKGRKKLRREDKNQASHCTFRTLQQAGECSIHNLSGGQKGAKSLAASVADSKHCLPTILLQQHPAPRLHPFEDRETKAMVSLNCCDCVGTTGASVIPLPVPVPLPVFYVSPSLLACFLTLYVSACLFLRVSSITIIFPSLFVPVPSHSFLSQFPKVTNPF